MTTDELRSLQPGDIIQSADGLTYLVAGNYHDGVTVVRVVDIPHHHPDEAARWVIVKVTYHAAQAGLHPNGMWPTLTQPELHRTAWLDIHGRVNGTPQEYPSDAREGGKNRSTTPHTGSDIPEINLRAARGLKKDFGPESRFYPCTNTPCSDLGTLHDERGRCTKPGCQCQGFVPKLPEAQEPRL